MLKPSDEVPVSRPAGLSQYDSDDVSVLGWRGQCDAYALFAEYEPLEEYLRL